MEAETLRKSLEMKRANEELDHSNMLNESGHDLRKMTQTFYKRGRGESTPQDFGDLDLLRLIDD